MLWIDDKIFTKLTKEYFIFLEEKYDMSIQSIENAECIRYISNVTWLEVWYDKYSLFIEMGTNDGFNKTTLWDILQFVDRKGLVSSYMASDETTLRKGMQLLSDYVKLYCNKALIGDTEFYKEVKESKENHEKKDALKNKLNYIEELAKAAWVKQDYNEVINIYEPILEHLSPMQNKRLNICYRRRETG